MFSVVILYSQICDLHPSIPAYRPPCPGVTIQSLQMDQNKEETKAKNGVIMCNLTVITTMSFLLFSLFFKRGVHKFDMISNIIKDFLFMCFCSFSIMITYMDINNLLKKYLI